MKGLSDMFNNFRFKVLFWFLSLLKLTVYNLPTHYVFFMYLSRFYRLCFKKFIMPGRNHFKDKWLDCTDNNGDKVGLYLHQNGEFGAKCFWCVREFDISSSGFIAITRHADTKRHKSIADLRQNRVINQSLLKPIAEADNSEEVDNPDVTLVPDDQNSNNVQKSSSQAKKNISSFFLPARKEVATSSNNNIANNNKIPLSDQVAKAEILLLLQNVYKNGSFRSLDDFDTLLCCAFPDSQIAKKVSFSRTKASYVVSEALAPYLKKELLDDIKKSDVFVIGIDTATTSLQGLSKSLDLKIRYYSEKFKMIKDSVATKSHNNSTLK